MQSLNDTCYQQGLHLTGKQASNKGVLTKLIRVYSVRSRLHALLQPVIQVLSICGESLVLLGAMAQDGTSSCTYFRCDTFSVRLTGTLTGVITAV